MKMGLILILFILSLPFSPTAFAASEEELATLRMFYKEEDIYVVSATRFPKLKSQTAENITVITAKEIEEMNAHTLGDVLNGIPGVQIDSYWGTGAEIFTFIQGSAYNHVLVLIDGVHINSSAYNAYFGAIPVQNIERVEVIKGPASSAWGSSLGGVINVITKSASLRKFSGLLSASQGEMNTGDFRAEATGRADAFSYYLSGGSLRTNGRNPGFRVYDNNLYAKLGYDLNERLSLTFTASYNKGHKGLGQFPDYDETDKLGYEYFFSTISADYSFNGSATLKLSLSALRQKASWDFITLSTGDIMGSYNYDVRTDRGSAIFSDISGIHTFVVGSDFDNVTSISNANTPEELSVSEYAFFANDTFGFGNFTITPGVRYDHTSTTGGFVSPSLGATYRLGDRTILRFSAARGFNTPRIADVLGSTIYYHANPNLRYEKIWSYQAGIETTAVRYLRIKATLFHHRVSDAIDTQFFDDGTFTSINKNRQKRQGIEFEVSTMPVFNTSGFAGVYYIDSKDLDTGQKLSIPAADYTYDIGLRYNDNRSLNAMLRGRYVRWNREAQTAPHDGFVWDINVSKKVYTWGKRDMEIFLTAHNVFDSLQYGSAFYPNPNRWFEGGVRYKF